MSYQEEISKSVAEFNKQKNEFTERAKKLLKESFNEFFKNTPEVKTVIWEQYTPYFNDGDPCIFSVGELSFSNSQDGEEIDYGEYSGDDETIWVSSNYFHGDANISENTKKEITAFDKAITSLPDEIFEDIFGDHVKIIASSSGFDVSEFDHD